MAVLTVALKTLFSLLICVMAVALVYGFLTDYYVSCSDLKARWLQVGFMDFFIKISLIAAWFFYKESRWILRIVFIFLLFWLGSFPTCIYIALQLFKLSPEESSKDPFYFVLVRRQKRDAIGCTGRISIVTTRIIFISLGCLMLGILVFAFVIYGSPFHVQVLSSCMKVLLIDLSIFVVVFSVWVAYKESSWINALVWILLIMCFGSITLCAYVARELFYLSPDQPIFLVLFNKSNRPNVKPVGVDAPKSVYEWKNKFFFISEGVIPEPLKWLVVRQKQRIADHPVIAHEGTDWFGRLTAQPTPVSMDKVPEVALMMVGCSKLDARPGEEVLFSVDGAESSVFQALIPDVSGVFTTRKLNPGEVYVLERTSPNFLVPKLTDFPSHCRSRGENILNPQLLSAVSGGGPAVYVLSDDESTGSSGDLIHCSRKSAGGESSGSRVLKASAGAGGQGSSTQASVAAPRSKDTGGDYVEVFLDPSLTTGGSGSKRKERAESEPSGIVQRPQSPKKKARSSSDVPEGIFRERVAELASQQVRIPGRDPVDVGIVGGEGETGRGGPTERRPKIRLKAPPKRAPLFTKTLKRISEISC